MSGMLSIVIITKDTKDLLQQLLRSIEHDRSLKAFLQETVVIDNASADGTGDMIGSEFPWTIYIRNDRNRGFAASANQGVDRSTGKYALLLNSDTILIEGEITKMLAFMEEREDVGICGPQLVYPDMRPQRSSASIPSLPTELLPFRRKPPADSNQQTAISDQPSAVSRQQTADNRSLGSHCEPEGRGNLTNRIATVAPRDDSKIPNVEPPIESFEGRHGTLNVEPIPLSGIDVPSIIGAAMMIRKSLFKALSGFDEQFFFFLEETDLCLRTTRQSAGSRQQAVSIIDNRSSIIDETSSQLSALSSPPDVSPLTPHPSRLTVSNRVVLLPDVRVIHLQGKTVGKNWIKGRIEYNISLYKFIKKHHSPLYYRTFQAVRFLKSSIVILVLSLLPFLLVGRSTRRRYIYYWKVLLWHLTACPPTAGLRPPA